MFLVLCLRPICLSSGVWASLGPVSGKSSKQWLQVWEALSPGRLNQRGHRSCCYPLSISHLQRMAICLFVLIVIPCPALLSSLGNYISQAPLPCGFLVRLANGKRWQAGGGENPRYFSLSI